MFSTLFFGAPGGVPRSSSCSKILVVLLAVFLVAGHLLGAMVVFTSAVVPNIFLMSPTLPAESVVTFLGGSLSSSLSPHTLGGTMWGGFCCRKTGKGSCGAWVVVGGEMLAILGVFNPAQCAIL